ncbi:cbb3-type cytochrome oxidase assembly protein CcoS [Luteimonas sp. SJ-92]|uniref:Cbb3-type cytochrome oxidase assembly protein CcoS n=1 Tax=Luteimonas salinisoli TaxID=2752307 RepID=A0A853JJ32_9GAMM|nr:cbb3-type cytochrome oxidase assembly protein CcoS [Luteimonas salinisoli]NZA28537.1 cbb3-type cytochrome oxidase assembly protein CcoS [Luteimonas salinisoli]
MTILLLLIPLSLMLVLVAVGAFVWAVRRGQFDDLDTPAIDILGDDDAPLPPEDRGPEADRAQRHDDAD